MSVRFVVVNGYGCHLVPELTEYLDEVGRFVREHPTDYLVFCGGATQRKSAPGSTEAGVMAEYVSEQLRSRYPHQSLPEFIIEDDSYTTLENVQNTMHVIHARHGLATFTWLDVEVDVFCETQRALKTLMLYWLLFPEIRKLGRRVRVHTVSWELGNPLKEVINIVFDLAAVYIPGLAGWARRRRLKRSRLI